MFSRRSVGEASCVNVRRSETNDKSDALPENLSPTRTQLLLLLREEEASPPTLMFTLYWSRAYQIWQAAPPHTSHLR